MSTSSKYRNSLLVFILLKILLQENCDTNADVFSHLPPTCFWVDGFFLSCLPTIQKIKLQYPERILRAGLCCQPRHFTHLKQLIWSTELEKRISGPTLVWTELLKLGEKWILRCSTSFCISSGSVCCHEGVDELHCSQPLGGDQHMLASFFRSFYVVFFIYINVYSNVYTLIHKKMI